MKRIEWRRWSRRSVSAGLALAALAAACSETLDAPSEPGTPDAASSSSSGAGQSSSSSGSTGAPGTGSSSSGGGASSSGAVDPGAQPECTFGEQREAECGECGTQIAFCSELGVWNGFGACQEAASCPDAGDGGDEDGGSGDAGDGGVDPGTPEPGDHLLVPAEIAASAEGVFTLGQEKSLRLLSASAPPCKLSGAPFFTETHFTYVRIDNPHAAPAKVALRVSTAPNESQVDVLMAAYANRSDDADEVQRSQCLTGADVNCFADFGNHACLIGSKAVTVPARGSLWAYVGNYHADDEAAPFLLRVTRVAE